MTIDIILSGLIAGQSATPPPIEQDTADCTRPTYASDQLICDDPVLLEQERSIASLLDKARPLISGAWLEDQPAWFRRRALCAFQVRHRLCLTQANAERLSLLQAVSDDAAPPGHWARCDSGGDVARQRLTIAARWVAARDADGRPAWFSTRRASVWKPFVALERGRAVRMTRQDGARMTCILEPT